MRIGTRGSALALVQARLVARLIAEATPQASANGAGKPEIVVVRTSGDRDAKGGDKSRWVAELEHALLAEEIDLAVHSAKDVPGELANNLELLGAPARAAAEDALVGARSLEELPEGACVGTSSVRRTAQLRATRRDLNVVSLRGNVDTRLRKLASRLGKREDATDDGGVSATHGERATHGGGASATHGGGAIDGGGASEGATRLHAIVLASAGLWRLGREHDIGCTLDAGRFVPAPGQGALALQARVGDAVVRSAVEPILDKDASACLIAERALARALEASCNTPLGAHATPAGCGCLHLRGWVGAPDGSEWVADELLGGFYDPEELGRRMAERLETMGARELLRRAEEMAVERT